MVLCIISEKAMQFGIDLIYHLAQMVLVVREIIVISFNDKHPSEIIRLDPGFITFVQSFQVIKPY
jgi:hypothetical protein